MGRAARKIEVHRDLLIDGIAAIQQRRDALIRSVIRPIGGLCGIIAIQDLPGGVGIDQGRYAAVRGAGPQGDDGLAFFAHLLGHLDVLLIPNAAADEPHCGLGDLQVISISQLSEILVIHQDRAVDELHGIQDREEPLAHVHQGDFTART